MECGIVAEINRPSWPYRQGNCDILRRVNFRICWSNLQPYPPVVKDNLFWKMYHPVKGG